MVANEIKYKDNEKTLVDYKTNEIFSNIMGDITEIIVLSDNDPKYLYRFELWKNKNVKNENIPIHIVNIKVLSTSELENSFRDKYFWSERFQKDKDYLNNLKETRIKLYYDYNFGLKSIALFNKKNFNYLDCNNENFISNNMIQILFFLENNIKEDIYVSEYSLYDEMDHWNGEKTIFDKNIQKTYKNKISIGSMTSKAMIVWKIKNQFKLIEIKNSYIFLTPNGEEFINTIRKNFRDLEFPFRLKYWQNLSEDEAMIKIEKYLNHRFFRQQSLLPK